MEGSEPAPEAPPASTAPDEQSEVAQDAGNDAGATEPQPTEESTQKKQALKQKTMLLILHLVK